MAMALHLRMPFTFTLLQLTTTPNSVTHKFVSVVIQTCICTLDNLEYSDTH